MAVKRQTIYAITKKRQMTCYCGKIQIACAITEKNTDSMCYHGKKTVSMCYHEKKTDSMCYHDENAFLVAFSFKIVRRFRTAHISHPRLKHNNPYRIWNMKNAHTLIKGSVCVPSFF